MGGRRPWEGSAGRKYEGWRAASQSWRRPAALGGGLRSASACAGAVAREAAAAVLRPLICRCRLSPLPCSTARTLALCIHLATTHSMACPFIDTLVLSVDTPHSYISHGMRAALAGCRDRPQQPVSRTTSPRRRVTGTGEPYPPLTRMYCPQARACAHPHAARMCALRFCALPALPACVVAVLTLCARVVRRRAMWRKRACKAAGWGCGMLLVRAGMGSVAAVCV